MVWEPLNLKSVSEERQVSGTISSDCAAPSGSHVTRTKSQTLVHGPRAPHGLGLPRLHLCHAALPFHLFCSSPAGRLARSLPVHVFVLEVLWIDPVACIASQPHARLTAHVTGDPSHYVFDWTFGDGSPNVSIQGDPTVTHSFTHSGTFPLALVLSSRVNRAHYFSSVCVEPELGNVTLQPERQFVRLGDEARLVAHAWPPFPYRYTWDFGAEDGAARVGGPEATFTYRLAGSYLVTVTAANNISAAYFDTLHNLLSFFNVCLFNLF